MFNWFINLGPVWQAVLATCFTWFLTALGDQARSSSSKRSNARSWTACWASPPA